MKPSENVEVDENVRTVVHRSEINNFLQNKLEYFFFEKFSLTDLFRIHSIKMSGYLKNGFP